MPEIEILFDWGEIPSLYILIGSHCKKKRVGLGVCFSWLQSQLILNTSFKFDAEYLWPFYVYMSMTWLLSLRDFKP